LKNCPLKDLKHLDQGGVSELLEDGDMGATALSKGFHPFGDDVSGHCAFVERSPPCSGHMERDLRSPWLGKIGKGSQRVHASFLAHS
jgi:hypothetical protein